LERRKKAQLIAQRGVSFEEALSPLAVGGLLDILEHPNQDRYPTQRLFVVNIRNYAYIIPFVESDKEIFLKSVIPSRKTTRKYLR
jgi:hypothetical protein